MRYKNVELKENFAINQNFAGLDKHIKAQDQQSTKDEQQR